MKNPSNPFYKELLGEIYFANNDYDKAVVFQKAAIKQINKTNDLYYMMLGNYLLNYENEKIDRSNKNLKIDSFKLYNAYAWYLLSRAYADVGSIPLAN